MITISAYEYMMGMSSISLVEKYEYHSRRFLSSTTAETLHTEIVNYPPKKSVIVSDVAKQQLYEYEIGGCRRERLTK